MKPHTRRHTIRRYLTQPIQFGKGAFRSGHKGKMGDYSIRGMQFSSPVAMVVGDQIWIRTGRCNGPHRPHALAPEIDAVVCWCHASPGTDTPCYNVGVSFCNGPSRSHLSGRASR